MKIIDASLLDQLTLQAQSHSRRRKNWNFHASDDHTCHRLLNAIEPDSYIRPHRHLDPAKDETFVVLRGRLGILLFDDAGTVQSRVLLEPGGEAVGVDIPHGVFHTAVSLEGGTIFFEAKAGPYIPLTAAEQASWAPLDATPEVAAYLASLKQLFGR